MKWTITARTATFTLIFGALAAAGGWAGASALTGDLLASEARAPIGVAPTGPDAPPAADCGCGDEDDGTGAGDG